MLKSCKLAALALAMGLCISAAHAQSSDACTQLQKALGRISQTAGAANLLTRNLGSLKLGPQTGFKNDCSRYNQLQGALAGYGATDSIPCSALPASAKLVAGAVCADGVVDPAERAALQSKTKGQCIPSKRGVNPADIVSFLQGLGVTENTSIADALAAAQAACGL